MSKQDYRVLVIGTGFGRRVQLPVFARHPRFTVTAIASARPERAREAAEEFEIPHHGDDWRALLTEAPVDVVSTSGSLAFGKKAVASNTFMKMTQYGPRMALDDNPETRWATDAGTKQAWLEVDLGEPVAFGQVAISEAYDRVRRFELQYMTDDQQWMTFVVGTRIDEKYLARFSPVTAQRVRLNILEATEGPTLWEFQLMAPEKAR